MGIEPTRPAWKAGALPLSYTRVYQYERRDFRPAALTLAARFAAESHSLSAFVVRAKRLELPRRMAPDPKSGASANSATPACENQKTTARFFGTLLF